MANKLDNIPLELRVRKQWVCAGHDKKPINPFNGNGADVTNPHHWGTFEDAVEMFVAFPKLVMGVGFVLTKEDPYVIIDFDDKPAHPAPPGARQWFGQAAVKLGAYVEKSISGYGFHMMLQGDFPRGIKGHGFEMYGTDRYILITGDMVQGGPMVHDQEFIDSLAELIETSRVGSGGAYEFNEVLAKRDDNRVLRHLQALSSVIYDMGASGDWQSYVNSKPHIKDKSQSVADLALVQAICSCTESDEQVMRIWYGSALSPLRRPAEKRKPKPEDYMRRTIGVARAHVANDRANQPPPVDIRMVAADQRKNWEEVPPLPEVPVVPPAPPPAPGGMGFTPASSVPEAPPVEQYPGDENFPPGLVGRIARRFLQTANRPIPELALHAAFAYLAGIVGRAYNVNNMGLSLFMLVAAPSTIGKESMSSGIDQLNYYVRKDGGDVDQYFDVPGSFSSDVALKKYLAEHPCGLSVQTEFGKTLMKLNNPRDIHAENLKGTYMAIITKGGFYSRMNGHKTANDETSSGHIWAPNLSILAEGTPETIYPNLTIENVTEGLMGRFLMLDYEGVKPYRNGSNAAPPEPGLVQMIKDIVSHCNRCHIDLQAMHMSGTVDVKPGTVIHIDADAAEYERKLDDSNTDEFNITKGSDVSVKVKGRFNMLMLKLAGVLAVGVNPWTPTITLELMKWAEAYVRKCQGYLERKLVEGAIGGNVMNQRERELHRVSVEFIRTGIGTFNANIKVDALRKAGAVTRDFLSRRISNLKAFKEAGGPRALDETIQSLVDNDVFVLVPDSKERFNVGKAWYVMHPKI